MAGASSDQKLAAIITPAAKPSMAFSSERLTFLARNTVAAPAAVIPQVKSGGEKCLQNGIKRGKCGHLRTSGR